ncbi:Uncharacterized protein DBV15_10502 [Temnothorax longispinosus]|uniref:Uncharacterized protein n=1 Tax=Temnothorax longispinosus TaxID=300112 RepID=A0A4S2KH25_9HYME|nr:Uncharacterized protein DBV15_10502 [Temnothorax longispinosus]
MYDSEWPGGSKCLPVVSLAQHTPADTRRELARKPARVNSIPSYRADPPGIDAADTERRRGKFDRLPSRRFGTAVHATFSSTFDQETDEFSDGKGHLAREIKEMADNGVFRTTYSWIECRLSIPAARRCPHGEPYLFLLVRTCVTEGGNLSSHSAVLRMPQVGEQ